MKNHWPIKKLGEIAFVDWGNTSITKKSYLPSGYPAFSAAGCDGFMKSFEHDMDAVILSAIGARCGKTFFASGKWTAIKNTIIIHAKDDKVILNKFIFAYLDPAKWPVSGAGQPFITIGNAKKIEIPIAPLEIQKKIVERLDAIKKAQELNDRQISKTDELFESVCREVFAKEWPSVNIEDVATISSGGTPSRKKANFYNGNIPWVKSGEVRQGLIVETEEKLTGEALKNSSAKIFPKNTVLIAMYGATAGQVGILGIEAATNQAIAGVIADESKVMPYYLFYFYKQQTGRFVELSGGGAQPNISQTVIKNYPISFPPLSEQQKIVTKLNAIQDYKKLLQKQKELLQELFDSVLYKSIKGEI